MSRVIICRMAEEHFQSCLLSQMTWLKGDKSTLEASLTEPDDCNLDMSCQWRLLPLLTSFTDPWDRFETVIRQAFK